MQQLEQAGTIDWVTWGSCFGPDLLSLAQCHVLFTDIAPRAPDVTWANEGLIEMTNSYLITNYQVPGVDILSPSPVP